MGARSKGFYFVMVGAGASIILAAATLWLVWWKRGELIEWAIFLGSILVFTSAFLIAKAYTDKQLPFKRRLVTLFIPISTLLVGVASIFYGIFPEGPWWIPILLIVFSVIISQGALVLAVLGKRGLLGESEETP